MKKKIPRNWLWIIGIIIILILFFYPKYCGNWGTAIHPDARYKDCTCIGLKTSGLLGAIRAGGDYLYCWGTPISYSCYYYEGKEIQGIWKVEKVYIPCVNECEIHDGKCYGFGDFVKETCEDHEMVTLPYNCPQITLNTQCCIKNSNCFWKSGLCLALVTPGYYYDSQAKECRYYQGSGCSSPPFSTMQECVSVCK